MGIGANAAVMAGFDEICDNQLIGGGSELGILRVGRTDVAP